MKHVLFLMLFIQALVGYANTQEDTAKFQLLIPSVNLHKKTILHKDWHYYAVSKINYKQDPNDKLTKIPSNNSYRQSLLDWDSINIFSFYQIPFYFSVKEIDYQLLKKLNKRYFSDTSISFIVGMKDSVSLSKFKSIFICYSDSIENRQSKLNLNSNKKIYIENVNDYVSDGGPVPINYLEIDGKVLDTIIYSYRVSYTYNHTFRSGFLDEDDISNVTFNDDPMRIDKVIFPQIAWVGYFNNDEFPDLLLRHYYQGQYTYQLVLTIGKYDDIKCYFSIDSIRVK